MCSVSLSLSSSSDVRDAFVRALSRAKPTSVPGTRRQSCFFFFVTLVEVVKEEKKKKKKIDKFSFPCFTDFFFSCLSLSLSFQEKRSLCAFRPQENKKHPSQRRERSHARVTMTVRRFKKSEQRRRAESRQANDDDDVDEQSSTTTALFFCLDDFFFLFPSGEESRALSSSDRYAAKARESTRPHAHVLVSLPENEARMTQQKWKKKSTLAVVGGQKNDRRGRPSILFFLLLQLTFSLTLFFSSIYKTKKSTGRASCCGRGDH